MARMHEFDEWRRTHRGRAEKFYDCRRRSREAGTHRWMPQAPNVVLDGSLEVLQNVADPPWDPYKSKADMPRADLETPLNGPKKEKWWYEENPEQGLQRMGWWGKKLDQEGCCDGGLFGGVIDDYRRRLPNYGKDITQGFSKKTLSSALFMFFATFFSTASLGALIQKTTNKRIGLEEYLLMNAIAGMTHALFGCQPLLVLRPTGPITAICTLLSVYADKFELDFNQYLGATGFFVGLYMTLIASTEFCRMIKHLTRFTHDIFAFFVCSIYIHDGISDVIAGCTDPDEREFGISLFSTLLAIIVFVCSMWLNFAITWPCFNDTVRGLLTDYAVTISVFLVIFLSNQWSVEQHDVPRIEVPSAFAPTCHHDVTHNSTTLSVNYDCLCSSHQHCTFVNSIEDDSDGSLADAVNGTVHARQWQTSYGDAPAKLWLISAISALPIVMFFYFDQNLSSLLTQQPYMNLRFGSFYHSSFLAMGVFNFIGPSFGLPFVTGSLPHSPQMVKALTNYKQDPDGTFQVTGVAENRIAPFLMYLLIGLPVLTPHLLEQIPSGALNGVLTFVGVAGLFDCQLWERLQCLFKAPSSFNSRYAGLDWKKVHFFTFLQVLFLVLFWLANLYISFFVVPLLLCTTVAVRRYVMESWFTDAELEQVTASHTIHRLSRLGSACQC